jgi:hypothetical protein
MPVVPPDLDDGSPGLRMNTMLSSRWKVFSVLFPLLPFLPALATGCGNPEEREGGSVPSYAPTEAPKEVWTFSDLPSLEIGVREGEEPYQLHRAQSSVLLGDGRIVVANAGSQELRFFDSEGLYLSAVGEDGEGPGEFRFPTRIRKVGQDSLLVWDQRLQRVSFFDFEGRYLGSERLSPTSEVMFPGDEWLLGRFWIDSPLLPSAREPVRVAAEAIPLPDSLQGLLYLRVTRQGRIWASEIRPPADTAISWTVYDLEGRSVARVTTPAHFEPHEIGADYVLGRFMDDVDINYIRLYGLEKPEGSQPGPGLDPSPPRVEPGPRLAQTPQEGKVLAPLKSLVKSLASLQEIHYSDHYTYTADTESLFSDPRARIPDGLAVTILFAGRQGWMGTVTDTDSGKYCALAYGAYVPMGWAPGMLICP